MTVYLPESRASWTQHLAGHPHISNVTVEPEQTAVAFDGKNGQRIIHFDSPELEVAGVVELMDNNPLVCGYEVSLPSEPYVLPVLAIAPLIQADLLADEPAIHTNLDGEAETLERWLRAHGGTHDVIFSFEPIDLDGVVATTVFAPIKKLDDPSELDQLFAEKYERSFFVRRDETSDWDTSLVKGHPTARFRLRLSVGEDRDLLTIQLMADQARKLGWGRFLHAFNVMNGFEESLGII